MEKLGFEGYVQASYPGIKNAGFSDKFKNAKNSNVSFASNSLALNDEFSGSGRTNSQEKVGFREGIKLIGKGFVNKLKNMATSIVKHPLKTALAVGVTSLAIMAAPLIGITSATAGAVLALGFAAFAVGKTTVDIAKTIKHNRQGQYNEVREDLQKIGGDGVDLALSLPFAPKAINQVTRFAKYGTSTVGLNTELLSNLKNCRSVSDASLEFAKANTLINYEMIGNEMGLAVKPKLVFKDMMVSETKGIIGGEYEPTTGELRINKNILSGKGKKLAKMANFDNTEVIMRHELEHFKQFSDIARTENIGVDGFGSMLTEYYGDISKNMTPGQIEEQGISRELVDNMTIGDKSAFNREFYQEIVDKQGVIKTGTPEAEMAARYRQGLIEKINPSKESIAQFKEATKGLNTFNPMHAVEIEKAKLELYRSNILEKEAFAAQDAFMADVVKMRPTIVNDGLMADAAAATFSDDDIPLLYLGI